MAANAMAMATTLTRQQLHALVWQKPMTSLAPEFGISDVGLRKLCVRHNIPTPRAGHWAKKTHGRRVSVKPLPDPDDNTEVRIHGGAASNETEAMANARAAVAEALQRQEDGVRPPNPLVEKSVAKLRKAKRDFEGLVHSAGAGLVRMAVRPVTVERAGSLLAKLVAAGEAAGLQLTKTEQGAGWLCDGETIDFELIEAADQVEHVATAKELAGVAKWKREREERHKRYGYWSDWGEPKIPKWEQHYQGRLQVKLEEVRLKTERSWWGEAIQRTFSETRKRALDKAIPKIIATVAAMAVAKRSNTEFEERRRLAEAEAARRRAEEERRRLAEQRAVSLLEQLVDEQTQMDRLSALVKTLRQEALGERAGRLVQWAELRFETMARQLSPGAIEGRLAAADLFGPDQTPEPR